MHLQFRYAPSVAKQFHNSRVKVEMQTRSGGTHTAWRGALAATAAVGGRGGSGAAALGEVGIEVIGGAAGADGGWPAVRTMASWAGRRRTSSAVRRGRACSWERVWRRGPKTRGAPFKERLARWSERNVPRHRHVLSDRMSRRSRDRQRAGSLPRRERGSRDPPLSRGACLAAAVPPIAHLSRREFRETRRFQTGTRSGFARALESGNWAGQCGEMVSLERG
jgi:hypothetical protein